MKPRHPIPARSRGFSLLEVMISLVILLFGILGMAALMVAGQRAEMESYQRAQALLLMQDMVGRLQANRTVASCYAVTTASSGTPFYGTGTAVTPNCGTGSIQANAQAVTDMTAWTNLLLGTTELNGTANVGTITGARGCVTALTTANSYMITVVWQGLSDTAAPPSGVTCGTGLYGAETKRRAVSTVVLVPNLN